MINWKKGTQLNQGQFVIQSIQGFSTYKAINRKNNQLVTIKTISTDDSEQQNKASSQEKIKQLIKISNCRHPNLVKVYPQLFNDYNQTYLVMEYVQGKDLASYIDLNGKLAIQEALEIIEKLGSALNVLHQQGFIHQSIKPHKIILRSQNSQPVLNDFGLAIPLFSDQEKASQIKYMDSFTPLEIYHQPNQIGIHTDIYSLAAILYVLLTSQLPTPSDARKNNQLIPPQKLNPDISDHLNEAILKGMELKPLSRPQTLKQWFDNLPPSQEFVSPNKIPIQLDSHQKKVTEQTNLQAPEKLTSKPKIQEFDFETISLEMRPKLLSFISPIKKNFIKKTGKYFSEELDKNVTIEMINIPSGTFIIGSNSNELERCPDESPQKRITIKSFYMSKFPITQLQWRIVASFPKIKRSLKMNPSYFKGDNLPVEKVSWYDAIEFSQRLTQYAKRKYRLPTEAEWEYACRAGTSTAFNCGEVITTDLANYDGRKAYIVKKTDKYEKKTTPVNSFLPNPFGLYDLHGNVWEWCEDNYASSYISKPTDGNPYYSDLRSQPRAVRGGSWSLNPSFCRSGKRSGYMPDANYNFVGFRVVCDFN